LSENVCFFGLFSLFYRTKPAVFRIELMFLLPSGIFRVEAGLELYVSTLEKLVSSTALDTEMVSHFCAHPTIG